MRILARAITAASAPVAVFRRELVPGQMCSCRGVLKSPGGLELLAADVVALWVASGDEYGGTLEDVNVGRVYALPWIIRGGAAGVRLTGAAPSIRRWWKLAQSKPGSLLVVFEQFVSADESLVQCRHLEYYCLLRLVLCLIQFDQISASSGFIAANIARKNCLNLGWCVSLHQMFSIRRGL